MAQLGTEINSVDLGNTKRSRSRNWCFTWNNYTEEDILYVKSFDGTKYVFQEEMGEQKTPHLQGFIEFKNPIEFASIKQYLPKCHIEKCKSKKASIAYCTKLESRTGRVFENMGLKLKKPIKDPMDGLQLKGWQNDIIKLIKEPADNRKIYWFWDKKGATGKSSFAKHLCMKYGAVALAGKGADIKYAVACLSEEMDVEIVILDVPRNSLEFVSYQAIEEIKNGLFFSGKYESKQILMNQPHIIVFANEEPKYSAMSEDRWEVREID